MIQIIKYQNTNCNTRAQYIGLHCLQTSNMT